MRLLLVAVCLLLPAASASVLEPGSLGVERVDGVPGLTPFGSGEVRVDLEYACAGTDTDAESLRVHVNATARQRSDGAVVPVDEPGTQIVELQRCMEVVGERSEHFDVRVHWTHGDFLADDVLDVEVTVWAEIGEGQTYRQIPAVTVGRSIGMFVEPESEVAPVAQIEHVETASAGQTVPGPALPLLAAGLLALARRR